MKKSLTEVDKALRGLPPYSDREQGTPDGFSDSLAGVPGGVAPSTGESVAAEVLTRQVREVVRRYSIQSMRMWMEFLVCYYAYAFLRGEDVARAIRIMERVRRDGDIRASHAPEGFIKEQQKPPITAEAAVRLASLKRAQSRLSVSRLGEERITIGWLRQNWPAALDYATAVREVERLLPCTAIRFGHIRRFAATMLHLAEETRQEIRRATPEAILHSCHLSYMAGRSYDAKTGLLRLEPTSANESGLRKHIYALALRYATDGYVPSLPGIGSSHRRMSRLLRAQFMLQARQQNIGGIWGLLFFDDPREYLQRLACYDRLFSEAQMTVPAALEIAECALKRCRPGTAIGQPAKTLEILECLYTAFPAATICSEDELQQRICGETIGKADVSAFLRQFASHGCVNQQHVEPLDPTDSHRYIFHRLPWGKYVLPPPPLSAHGAVLAIQDAMRTDGLSELGHEFEGAVRDLIGGQLKITVPSGKYVLDGVVYETDGFLNAGETLICLECKTKGLTDKARRGSITALIGDLWRSFLSSALQGLRLELAMRTASEQGRAFLVYSSTSEDKAILRHRAGPSWEVAPEEVRNARFVRLGVSLSEYGVFQQPAVVKNLLRIGMLYGFRMEEESAIATRFNETAVTSGKLQDVVLALLPHYEGASQDDRLQKLVHSSLFLSYDSLRSLVHASSSGKDFAGRLVRMLSVQPGAASLQSLRAMAALVHRGPADSRQVSDESDA